MGLSQWGRRSFDVERKTVNDASQELDNHQLSNEEMLKALRLMAGFSRNK